MRLIVRNLAGHGGERVLFRGLDLVLQSGEALIVTGPNGSGKTTLLRSLAGFTAAHEGRIVVEGSTQGQNLQEAVHFIGHRDGLRAALTLRENLELLPAVFGQPNQTIPQAADRLDLTRLLDLPVGVLSAGQRRRAALARLLVVKRPIWLLDEPTSALDIRSTGIVEDLLRTHVSAGGIAIAATHLPLGLKAGELRIDADGSYQILPCVQTA